MVALLIVTEVLKQLKLVISHPFSIKLKIRQGP